jgi:hypothetical protein
LIVCLEEHIFRTLTPNTILVKEMKFEFRKKAE